MHYGNDVMGTIRGILYRGDPATKYSKDNSPKDNNDFYVRPKENALIMQLPNEEEASKMMLHMIDFEENRRQILPTVPTTSELQNFVISPQRHAAYESIWRLITLSGVVANTALWLYF